MEIPQEDEGPQREPYDKWLLDTLMELQEEAAKHFTMELLQAVGNYSYEQHGESIEGVKKMITLLNRALFLHYRHGWSGSRVGTARGRNPLQSIPISRNTL
ncbi:vpr protein [Simian immunodeficiency virus]|uniref:Protein Vpr n=1 Tax=Simian immunodeficiency virus TaxID=11723 RepID=E1ANV0_SIV|nr:vpr protein [Simian immunodeficiency virus]